MGTNFYARRKISQKQRNEFCDYIENNEVLKAENFLNDLKEATKKIHIGKRSSGWKFLWDCNDFKYFEPNVKSILKFLGECEIENEYRECFTLEQFLNEEIGEFLKSGYDVETFYKNNPKSNKHYVEQSVIKDFKNRFNIDVNPYGEFYIGDLRFYVSDFS